MQVTLFASFQCRIVFASQGRVNNTKSVCCRLQVPGDSGNTTPPAGDPLFSISVHIRPHIVVKYGILQLMEQRVP